MDVNRTSLSGLKLFGISRKASASFSYPAKPKEYRPATNAKANAGLCLRGFEKIVREVGLALMMGFVPADDIQNGSNGPAAFFQRLGNFAESRVVVTGQRFEQMRTRVAQDGPNFVHRRNGIVGSAAAAKAWPKFLVARRAARIQTLGREDLFGDGDVHKLPSQMRPAGSRSPTEAGFILRHNPVEEFEGHRTIELKGLD